MFSNLSYTKNDTVFLQTLIASIHVRKKIIGELCGIIGQKDDACIIHNHNFLPPGLRRSMKKINVTNDD